MTDKQEERSVLTPEFRLSFPHLITPREKDSGGKSFEATGIFLNPNAMTPQDQAKWVAMLELAKRAKLKKFPKSATTPIPQFHQPFRYGTPEEYDLTKYPEYAGMVIAPMRSNNRPVGVCKLPFVNGKPTPVSDPMELYAGCYCIARVTAYAYDSHGKKGVTFGLQSIMKVREGEPLITLSNPDEDFKDVDPADFGVDNAAMFEQDGGLLAGI